MHVNVSIGNIDENTSDESDAIIMRSNKRTRSILLKHLNEVRDITLFHSNEIQDIKTQQLKQIEELKTQQLKQIEELKNQYVNQIADFKKQRVNEIRILNLESANNLAELELKCEKRIASFHYVSNEVHTQMVTTTQTQQKEIYKLNKDIKSKNDQIERLQNIIKVKEGIINNYSRLLCVEQKRVKELTNKIPKI